MKNKKEIKFGYTTILHEPRLDFELSQNDYCIGDLIYNLSHNPQGSILGWCYASRETIGDFFGVSRPTVKKSIDKLVAKQLVEVHDETSHLRTTALWYKNFVLLKKQLKKDRV